MKAPIHAHKRKKVIRTAALSGSLYVLLEDQLRFLNQYYDILAIGSDPGHEYLQKLREREGIRGKEINIERKISIFKDLISLYRLYVVFRKEKPFMVHSITPKAGLLTMIAAYFARVPARVHTFTGLIFPTQTGTMKQVLLFFDKIICKFATHVYPEGNGVKNDLLNYKVTTKPLKVIANGNVNGIDLDKYTAELFSKEDNNQLRKTIGVSEEDFVFLFIGRLVNDKGVNELANAFDKLSSTHENVKLVMVGAHIGETDLLPDQTWAKINANNSILYVGHQDDVRPFLAMSNVFVFPSYREGFPNVVLEAGAMGLPAIVTDINGSNEIVVDGENGLIIPSKDEDALFKAMKILLTDNSLNTKLAKNARPMIASRFEKSEVWAAVLKEYQSIEQQVG
ncbi:Glycosyltransferase involved in cell wall bisynthesis [Maribacter orientalis]|uniref:Glycosyltransferase involved in cell wall bisynthesis n=1 Tax=Maribacter orientalis TaxID=228957 RepID=A0A1H7SK09_9FLAO|nr:glycosyltransferase family 4 protein [Maribacter orientalis]SEL71767.1 Glycosyltransferase involved in cell wall bisynthesis [Maribacter orientalis]